MTVDIICADSLDVMAGMDENSVDAVVTDPPYGLEFMGQEWDKLGEVARANRGTQPERKRPPGEGGESQKFQLPAPAFDLSLSSQLAVQAWHQRWATAALRVLKPGGHLVAFGGTRTHHRLWCALEGAGFEVRDTLCWLYGSGFPKGKACLKPAWEPIALARKPLVGTVVANVQAHGTGVLNVDGCRIDYQSDSDKASATPQGKATSKAVHVGAEPDAGANEERVEFNRPPLVGRWPANVVLDEEAAAMLDAQSGERKAGGKVRGTEPSQTGQNDIYGLWGRIENSPFGDSGGASRFFYVAKASRAERERGLDSMEIVTVEWETWEGEAHQARLRVDMALSPPRVTVVSGTRDSDVTAWNTLLFGSDTTASSLLAINHITVTAINSITESRTLNWLARSFTSACMEVVNGELGSGGSPAETAGRSIPSLIITSAKAASPLGVGPVASATRLRISGNVASPADHPTVKPLALMRWLVRLVTPPGGLILDPFVGSGTTALAAIAEGFSCVGIDNNAEYCEMAQHRTAQRGLMMEAK